MSRKYRQAGYQDDDPQRSGGRSGGQPRTRPEGPRGRGLGAPGKTVLRCRACGAEVQQEIVAESNCTGCGAALHTCTHCRHFDTGAVNECRVEEAAPISAKSKANECEWFEPRRTVESATSAKKETSDAKSEFDSLFDF